MNFFYKHHRFGEILIQYVAIIKFKQQNETPKTTFDVIFNNFNILIHNFIN